MLRELCECQQRSAQKRRVGTNGACQHDRLDERQRMLERHGASATQPRKERSGRCACRMRLARLDLPHAQPLDTERYCAGQRAVRLDQRFKESQDFGL
jgi:hypothetical protein